MKRLLSSLPILLKSLLVFSLFGFLFHNRYIVPVLPVVIGIFVYFISKAQRILAVKEYTSINQLREGLVKIKGKVSAGKSLESPFFKQECICYSY